MTVPSRDSADGNGNPSRTVDVSAVHDGFGPLAAVYGLWVVLAAGCIYALIVLRAPVESIVASVMGFEHAWQVERRYRFEATYLLVEILVGGALFALTIVGEYRLRTASAWAHTYGRPYYPELLRRFAQVALIPVGLAVIAMAAELAILYLR